MTQDSDPVSEQYFKEHLWDISKIGNDHKEDYRFYLEIIEYDKNARDVDGKPFTFSLLRDKYFRYFTIWNAKFGTRDSKYVGKSDKLMGVGDFILKDDWKAAHQFSDQLTKYLFGKNKIADYEEKLKRFRNFKGLLNT